MTYTLSKIIEMMEIDFSILSNSSKFFDSNEQKNKILALNRHYEYVNSGNAYNSINLKSYKYYTIIINKIEITLYYLYDFSKMKIINNHKELMIECNNMKFSINIENINDFNKINKIYENECRSW